MREKNSERERERYSDKVERREGGSLTLPTSPALFSEGTCCAILGRGPASEKREAEEVQQDGEKGRWGAGAGQGVVNRWGTKAPLVQALRGLDVRLEGWQAGW